MDHPESGWSGSSPAAILGNSDERSWPTGPAARIRRADAALASLNVQVVHRWVRRARPLRITASDASDLLLTNGPEDKSTVTQNELNERNDDDHEE